MKRTKSPDRQKLSDWDTLPPMGIDVDSRVKKLQQESGKVIKDQKVFRKFLEMQYNRVSKIEDLTDLPKENEQIRIITQKSFNAYAILLYVLEHKTAQEVYLTTYNMDKNTIKGLETLVQSNNIQKLTILISSSINFRMPDRIAELKTVVRRNEEISLILAWNHTKIIGVYTTDDQYYVIEGSGNLSDNARIEQYLFEQCKETYYFHKTWIEDIMDDHKYNSIEVY